MVFTQIHRIENKYYQLQFKIEHNYKDCSDVTLKLQFNFKIY